MSLKFPEVLTDENRALVMSNSQSWAAQHTKTELEAHEQVYDRAVRIWKALDKAGMDAWLNPGVQVDSTQSPQYQLQRSAGTIHRGRKEFEPLELITKINHRNLYIADISLVDFIDGRSEKGVSLSPDELTGPEQLAISSETEAFKFIDGVLEGLEGQAIDLGVIATSDQARVTPVAA